MCVCVCVSIYTHIYIYTYVQYNKIQYSTILHTRSLAHTHNIIEYNKNTCCITHQKVLGFLSSASRSRASIHIFILHSMILCVFFIEYNKKKYEKVLGFSSSASRGRASIRGALLSARLRYASEIRSLLYV